MREQKSNEERPHDIGTTLKYSESVEPYTIQGEPHGENADAYDGKNKISSQLHLKHPVNISDIRPED